MKRLASLQDMPYQSLMKSMLATQVAIEMRKMEPVGGHLGSWGLAGLGDTIEIDMGSGYQPYTLAVVQGLRLGVHPQAKRLADGESAPSFRIPASDEVVKLRVRGFERDAKIAGMHDGLTVVGPVQMRQGNDGCDCPYCWRQRIEGTPTGFRTGFGFGPKLPETIEVKQYECPDCQHAWSSLKWGDIVRRML